MWIRNLFNILKLWPSPAPVEKARREAARRWPVARRLAVEALEDRAVPAALSISDVTVVEGDSGTQNAALIVSLSEPSNKTVTVNYKTANGTALAVSDYNAVSGKLTFARGETNKSILVPIRGDVAIENSESFYVNLRNANGATIADGQGIITIVDAGENKLQLSASHEVGMEGGLLTFTVTLSAPLDQPFTVHYFTQDVTPVSWQQPMHAYAGQDYLATSGTLTFAPGETQKTFTVEVLEDSTPEYDEYFHVVLSGASADVDLGFPGTGTILGEYGPYEL